MRKEDMPVDMDGNRAQIIADPNSTISRMNLGRLYEMYYNACARDARKRIRDRLGIALYDKITVRELKEYPKDEINEIWEYLKEIYRIVSPDRMYEKFALRLTEEQVLEHLCSCINKWIYLYIPPENETENVEVIKQLEEFVKPTYGPVTYRGSSGQLCTTVSNVRIASMYYIELEKTGDDWTAVSTAKLQNYGFLSQTTNADKYSQPTRQQAIRAFAEPEVRIMRSYSGARATAEIFSRNNDPQVHYELTQSIITAENPSIIEAAIDRSKIKYNDTRPLSLFKHYAMCSGWRIAHGPHDPSRNIFGELTNGQA